MKMMLIWCILCSFFALASGLHVGFSYDKSCFSAGGTVDMTATYTGSGTVTAVQWYYSGQISQNVLVVAATCLAVIPIDAGYPPVAEMTFDCNLATNVFKLKLSSAVEVDFDKSWGVTFSLSAGASPDVVQKQIEQCTTSTEDKTSDTDAIVGGTVGGVLGLCCLAAAVVGIRHLKKKGSTTTLTFVEGSKVTFSCPFPESVTFPEWRGPPGLTIYTILDDTSGTINSKIPAFNRLQYASNKRDLILSNAVIGDSGDYKCSYTGQGDHTFTLKVIRGKGDQASNVVNAGSHRPGRPQPPPPSGANSNHREGSGSVVSGRDVEMQETETSFKRRQLPDIHDKKGRGLSANYNDDDHPLVSINIPTKKPGALESIPDSDRQEVTKKKKKRKKRVETEDNQSD